MPKYIKELTLDISGKRNNQTITAKQGDNKSRFIRITLVDGETKVTLEQGENVDFRCLKPDKKSCKLPTTIEEGGTILVELNDNSLAVAGLVRADVEINNADGLALSSTTFYIQVEPSADNGNYLPSTSNQKMARSLDMDGHGIQNLPAPTENGDAVNKEYVDSLQSDMNVNDESNPAFIKNRTHWKEKFERDYTVLPNVEPDPTIGVIEYGQKIGLEIGKEYTLETHLKDGTIETIQAVAIEMPEDEFGIAGIPCIILEGLCSILDGIVADFTTQSFVAGDNCYYYYDDSIIGVLEKGVIVNLPNVETVIHKIPSEYVDIPKVDQVFNSKSENAQSGIAVAQAINEYDKSLVVPGDKIKNNSITAAKILHNTKIGSTVLNGNYSTVQVMYPLMKEATSLMYCGTLSFYSPGEKRLVVYSDSISVVEVVVDCSEIRTFDFCLTTKSINGYTQFEVSLRSPTATGYVMQWDYYSVGRLKMPNCRDIVLHAYDADNVAQGFGQGTNLTLYLLTL